MSKCYDPRCGQSSAISKNGVKLSACTKHLHNYYSKCTMCIINDRAKDTRTQRLLLFCSDCYQKKYLKSRANTNKCDRCKTEVCSPDHRICLTCRRLWRTFCVICRKNVRQFGNKYHCDNCNVMYQKNGCQAKIWINSSVGRKRCWSIASKGTKYCQRCNDYGICRDHDCHNLSSQEYCIECQKETKDIINELNLDKIRLIPFEK